MEQMPGERQGSKSDARSRSCQQSGTDDDTLGRGPALQGIGQKYGKPQVFQLGQIVRNAVQGIHHALLDLDQGFWGGISPLAFDH